MCGIEISCCLLPREKYVFTTWSADMGTQLNVQAEGNLISTTNCPKILGVTFDSIF